MPSPHHCAVTSTDGTTIGYHTLGAGPGIVVVGGALRAGEDYLPLGRALARSRTAHLMDRRGRGSSGPQGSDYSIDRECDDLKAVIAATDARAVFGHSYGGLVALESARRERSFPDLIVYEPGVSVHGSLPLGWIPRYRELLDRGDARGAFTCMVRQAGFAPAMLARMPAWCARTILKLVVKGRQWQAMKALLRTHLLEGEQAALLDGDVSRFSTTPVFCCSPEPRAQRASRCNQCSRSRRRSPARRSSSCRDSDIPRPMSKRRSEWPSVSCSFRAADHRRGSRRMAVVSRRLKQRAIASGGGAVAEPVTRTWAQARCTVVGVCQLAAVEREAAAADALRQTGAQAAELREPFVDPRRPGA
jgi:pimeloyl-ACP methyl ester carboxylesterase